MTGRVTLMLALAPLLLALSGCGLHLTRPDEAAAEADPVRDAPLALAVYKERREMVLMRQGAPADIVVYDLARLRRTPEWDYEIAHDFPANEWRRIQRAEGYRWTLVNGEVTFEEGRCSGATPGRLLRNREVATATLGVSAG